MRRLSFHGRTVLVTGAARGLGRQLALRLAVAEGADLILVDRDEQGLRRLAAEIKDRSSAGARVIARDLLEHGCAQSLFDELEKEDLFGLVNNAGLTYYGPTEGARLELIRSIVDLDFRLVVELSLLFIRRLKENDGGFICNVTSLGSFVPIPFQAVYAAAKAGAQSFSESLMLENRGGPVVISTVAPSGIVTDMISESGLTRHMQRHSFSYLSAEDTAAVVIKGLKRGKRLIIPGFVNRLIYLAINVLPRNLLLRLAGRIYDYRRYGKTN
jgi:short-subunit dehydrogenase